MSRIGLCMIACLLSCMASPERSLNNETKEIYVFDGEKTSDVCFEIRNYFDDTLVLNQVKLDCSCAHYKLSSKSIEPNQTAILSITYHIPEEAPPSSDSLHECVVAYSVGSEKNKIFNLYTKILKANRISLSKARLVWNEVNSEKQKIKIEAQPGIKIVETTVFSPQTGIQWNQDPNDPALFWFNRPKNPGTYFVAFTLTLDSRKQEQVILPLVVNR